MDYIDSFCIGEFGDEFIFQESGIRGYLSYTIYVYGGERDIPHFHVIKPADNFECCVCIYEPKYFDHEGKTSMLNSKERKILNEFLKATSKINRGFSNWQAIEFLWNYANLKKGETPKQSTKSQQPDYTKMVDSIHKYK